MADEPNKVTYRGELVDGQLILNSVDYPSEFVGEDGQVVMTCESVPVVFQNVVDFDAEYPMATSPFCEDERPEIIARDQTVQHTTVGGKGVVGRITGGK
jgi:hypothetical protein